MLILFVFQLRYSQWVITASCLRSAFGQPSPPYLSIIPFATKRSVCKNLHPRQFARLSHRNDWKGEACWNLFCLTLIQSTHFFFQGVWKRKNCHAMHGAVQTKKRFKTRLHSSCSVWSYLPCREGWSHRTRDLLGCWSASNDAQSWIGHTFGRDLIRYT